MELYIHIMLCILHMYMYMYGVGQRLGSDKTFHVSAVSLLKHRLFTYHTGKPDMYETGSHMCVIQ